MKRRILVVSMVASLAAGCDPPPPPLPVIASVPDFSLIDESGRPIARQDLLGRVWIADFIFTHCAGPCPMMSRRMASLQTSLADLADVHLVSFSVDPERDTPPILREYGARYGARPQRWSFVTGGKKEIHRLAIDGFKLAVQDETDIDPILHSTRLMLVDRSGRIRGAFDGESDDDMPRLIAAVRALLEEPRPTSGPAS